MMDMLNVIVVDPIVIVNDDTVMINMVAITDNNIVVINVVPIVDHHVIANATWLDNCVRVVDRRIRLNHIIRFVCDGRCNVGRLRRGCDHDLLEERLAVVEAIEVETNEAIPHLAPSPRSKTRTLSASW